MTVGIQKKGLGLRHCTNACTRTQPRISYPPSRLANMTFRSSPDLNTGGARYMDLFPDRSEPLRRNHAQRSQNQPKSPLLRSRFIFPDSFKVLELHPKFSDDTWMHIHCNYNPKFAQGREKEEEEDHEDLLLSIIERYGWIAIDPSVGSATPEFMGRRLYILPSPRPAQHLSCIVCALLPWPVHDATEKELLEFGNGVGFLTVFGLKEYCRAKESEEMVLGSLDAAKLRERFMEKFKNGVLSKASLSSKSEEPRWIAERQCESPVCSEVSSEPHGADFDDDDDLPHEIICGNGSDRSEVRSSSSSSSSHRNGFARTVHSGKSSPVRYSSERSSSCSSKYSDELSQVGKNTKEGGLLDIAVRVVLEALAGTTVGSK